MKGRTILAAAAVLLAGVAGASADYPEKPITVVVGAAAGGGADIQARIMAERLSQTLGQQVLVDNKPGAGSNIASGIVAKAAPDGYTLTLIAPAAAINGTLYAAPGFDAKKDFAPVAGWASAPLMFVVNPAVAASTLKELADLSKANPGTLDYGNGVGFPNHMVMELYKIESGADIQFVPYPGLAPARTDVIAGVIEATVDTVASSGSFVTAGQLKALAVTSKERIAAFPDVQTVTEAGFPNLTRNTWYGLLAPAGTPQAVLDRLGAAVAEAQADAATAEKIKGSGAAPMVMGPADFTTFFHGEIDTWAGVIEQAKIEKVQ
jgi:tripartite-type tricarboxylate transporter receptor subunit TctC